MSLDAELLHGRRELGEHLATAVHSDQSSSRSLDDEGLGTGSPAQAERSGSIRIYVHDRTRVLLTSLTSDEARFSIAYFLHFSCSSTTASILSVAFYTRPSHSPNQVACPNPTMASLNTSSNGPNITRSYQNIVNSPPPSGPQASSPTFAQWAVFTVAAPLVSAFQQDGGKESVLKVQSTGGMSGIFRVYSRGPGV